MSNELRVSGVWRKLTKSDDVDIPRVTDLVVRALWVGQPGAANLIDCSGATAVNFPLKEGINQIRPRRLMTGGDADDIWALY